MHYGVLAEHKGLVGTGCQRKRNNEKHTFSFENIDFLKNKETELAFEF